MSSEPVPDLEPILKRFEEDGYVIVENAIAPELLDAVTAALDRLNRELTTDASWSEISDRYEEFVGTTTDRVRNVLAKDPVFQETVLVPWVLEFMERVLGPEFSLSTIGGITVNPGARAQAFHTDDMFYPLPRPHAAVACNMMWALSDFNEENGATILVPGSHRWERPPAETIDEAIRLGDSHQVESISAVMPRGSVLFWHGSLWHGAGANVARDDSRMGLALLFISGWLRPQENHLGLPLDLVQTFEPRLQELLGFGTYRNALGNLEGLPLTELLLSPDR